MNNKHFKSIADVFYCNLQSFPVEQDAVTKYILGRVINDLTGVFHEFNEHFDGNRFYNACFHGKERV